MNSRELDLLVGSAKTILKEQGFKKTKLTWHKETSDIILVFNIQRSQWGPEFYINLGVYIRALGPENKPPEYRCHIQSRVNHSGRTVEDLFNDVFEWFDKHGSIPKLRCLAKEDKLPLTTVILAKGFLLDIV